MDFRNKIYLDTSVISFLYADDAPEKQEITVDFFDNFSKTGIYQATITEFVLQEIENTGNEELRKKTLTVSSGIRNLVSEYKRQESKISSEQFYSTSAKKTKEENEAMWEKSRVQSMENSRNFIDKYNRLFKAKTLYAF